MRRLSLALCGLAFLALSTGCDSSGTTGTVRVMSQNLYLGADLFLVANEQDPNMIPVRVAQLYGSVQASDPAARMAAVAAEIARVNPDLVGLQEVTTYYVQSPGDNLPGAANTTATTVTFDFLQLLLDALADEGVSYTVAARADNADVEFPATTDGMTFFDVRYRDADVILARSDVQTSGAVNQEFQTVLTIPVGGVDQTFTRSYQSVNATVDGFPLTFFNTHLEVGGPAEPIQRIQAAELATEVRDTGGSVILVGDINSDGNTGGTSYQDLTVLLRDAFPVGSAATCCQAADLGNATSQLQTRIDVVLSRGFDTTVEGEVVLDTPADRVGGVWPSDHAGVWAELEGVVN
ncbi:MAG: hypothetical protein CMM84_05085 [Rhodothermaceae bacterium]|nr:hypothetical protein [Rhodothermaceae bacterium]MBC14345.1 hypothetical protein [Rhodothermaceae bacterium]